MTDFWDLPRAVRDKIYRLSLVQDKPITMVKHRCITHRTTKRPFNCFLPPILELSNQAEKEAAHIYYGENWFDVGDPQGICGFASITRPRHLKLVRKLRCEWLEVPGLGGWGCYGLFREGFLKMSKMNLEKLRIGVDEVQMLRFLKAPREIRQRPIHMDDNAELTLQQGLAVLRFPGMTGLLTITNILDVRFTKIVNKDGKEHGGPIPNGPLLSHILPRMRPKVTPGQRRRNRPFQFLDLPPEIRNRVYDLLLRIPGPIHPSTEPPTSAPKKEDKIAINESLDHNSVLSILAVNKQMHDEAIGVFYNANSFVFYYPVQLNAFLLSLGPQRQGLIQDLEIHYHNLKIGGIDLAELTFPMLRQLKCLKRLHIVMIRCTGWGNHAPVSTGKANPGLIPGIKYLFQLRGVTDICIRDIILEEKIEELKEHDAYPDFASGSSGDADNRKILQLARAYKHFNAALLDAQKGKVNAALLEDNLWHLNECFPEIDSEEEEEDGDEEEEGNEEEDDKDGEQECGYGVGNKDKSHLDYYTDPDHDSDSDWTP